MQTLKPKQMERFVIIRLPAVNYYHKALHLFWFYILKLQDAHIRNLLFIALSKIV